ncbi:RNA methyltransferase [Leptolyngbya sp. FACHB-261]|nr:RNA methyltransferase [Leptolyngbya sp. FACHB-261]
MITSSQNPLVKRLRKLSRAKDRAREGLLLLEGTHLLEEALRVGWPLEIVCYTPDWAQAHPELLSTIEQQAEMNCQECSPEVVAAITTTVSPDGVVAAAQRDWSGRPTLAAKSLTLVLETLQDPGNLGTIIRTAAAAGSDGLLLSADSADPENPKVLRASAGTWFHCPMQRVTVLSETIQALKAQGMQAIATLPTAPLTYWQQDLRPPTLILLGNEGAGLSPELIDLADHQVSVPLSPGVESLNVGITAALLLYEARRQRSF